MMLIVAYFTLNAEISTTYICNAFMMCYMCLYIYHPEPRFSCWMLYLICILHVICCIPASFRFGVWTPWRWHRRIKTCRSREMPYF